MKKGRSNGRKKEETNNGGNRYKRGKKGRLEKVVKGRKK